VTEDLGVTSAMACSAVVVVAVVGGEKRVGWRKMEAVGVRDWRVGRRLGRWEKDLRGG